MKNAKSAMFLLFDYVRITMIAFDRGFFAGIFFSLLSIMQ